MKKLTALFVITFSALSALAQDKIQNPRILLNEGNRYAQSSNVPIKIDAVGARQMMISQNSDMAGAEWTIFSVHAGFVDFGNEEGEKTVYVKLKDKYGNDTEILKQTIFLDKTPPKNNKVKITAEGGFVNNPQHNVKLEISAEDAKYMLVSNVATLREARWQALKNPYAWKLESGDGLKKVYVRFRDVAGNESETVVDEILVDAQAPVDAQISINNEQKVSTEKTGNVQLSLFVRGGNYMKIGKDKTLEGAEWQTYKTTLDWQLDATKQGEQSVFVKYKDQANNESELVSAKIILDTEPPQDCELIINDGAKYAEHPDKTVELKIKAKDAKFMIISNSMDFLNARWEPFKEVFTNWKLVGENGEKNIYIRFRDEHGNETALYKASIILAI